jgi:hypothetical protein
MSDTRAEKTAALLQPAIAALEADGSDRFNPVRFRYIKAMAARSLEQRPSVGECVARKAMAALHAYQSELSREQAAAKALIEQYEPASQDVENRLQQLFDSCNFKAIRLAVARRGRPDPSRHISELIRHLDAGATPGADQTALGRIGELLQQQEADAVKSSTVTAGDTSGEPQKPARELKAAGHFRESLRQHRADRLVARALLEAPAESGPLNPEKLAIRSLAAMRDLSPAYLARFSAYVETLFWLENAGPDNTS